MILLSGFPWKKSCYETHHVETAKDAQDFGRLADYNTPTFGFGGASHPGSSPLKNFKLPKSSKPQIRPKLFHLLLKTRFAGLRKSSTDPQIAMSDIAVWCKNCLFLMRNASRGFEVPLRISSNRQKSVAFVMKNCMRLLDDAMKARG